MAMNLNTATVIPAAPVQPGTTSATSNSEARSQEFFDQCKSWGEKAGGGDASKVGMILDIARASWDIDSPVCAAKNPNDANSFAARGYHAWREARIAKASELGKRVVTDDSKSRANRLSEINKYLRVGGLDLIRDSDMGGYGVLKRTVKIIRENGDIKGEVEDLLSKVATAQLKSPAVPLADDQIMEVLTATKVSVELTDEEAEAKLWHNVLVQIDSIRGKFPNGRNDPGIVSARAAVQQRIHDLGGTRAGKEAAIKAAEAAKKKAERAAKGKKKRK